MMMMMMIFNVFQTIGYYGYANWLPTLLIKQGVTVTTSLGYTTLIALAVPGPLPGILIGDRFERKRVIVAMTRLNVVCSLLFSQASSVVTITIPGVLLTLAGNIISDSYHTQQQQLLRPISGRVPRVRLFLERALGGLQRNPDCVHARKAGVLGVFVFIGCAMIVVIPAIGLMGPRTRGLELEKISH
ncbi:hypothetical protein [Bradyrhizobium sp. WSM3983]|uniref:hypothetical protein n=1 Tax=Bradyrhizobium sp. WSM3983 TaxID=1038867 RepID=UPI0003FCDBAB|nr:hypothetical protein [Bradyrhizobium sp. WSM3983]